MRGESLAGARRWRPRRIPSAGELPPPSRRARAAARLPSTRWRRRSRRARSPDQLAIDAESHAAVDALRLSVRGGADRGGARRRSLAIVSSRGTLADERSADPLVLGDDQGGNLAVVLTVRLDPLLEDSGD